MYCSCSAKYYNVYEKNTAKVFVFKILFVTLPENSNINNIINLNFFRFMRNRRFLFAGAPRIAAAALVAVVAMATACGGGGDDAIDDPPTTPPESPTTARVR